MQTNPASATPNSAYPFAPLCGGPQLKIQTTSKSITPFAGLLSFLAWLRRIGLPGRMEGLMPFTYTSPNAIPTVHTMLAFLVTVILGGSRFAHSDWLRFDTALHRLMGIARFPAKDAIRRFFLRFGQAEIEKFYRPLWAWLLAMWTPPPLGFTLDLDSTIFQRSGTQEGAAKGYNPQRRGRLSHHPLLAVLAEAPMILHAWLRSGNTAAGRGVVAFLSEALHQLPAAWRIRCVRADSGFFENAFLSDLEARGLPYIVVAKMTPQIKSGLKRIHHWRALDATHSVSEFRAQLQGWRHPRRCVVVREKASEKKAGQTVGRQLLDVPGYTYRVWCTNSAELPEAVWRDYNQRATIEQRIEELKNDLHADGFCTQRFFATEAAFLAVLFTFNLLATYQAQTMPTASYRQPATLLSALFIGGAILGRSGHNEVLRVSSNWGGAEEHQPLIDKAINATDPIASRFPNHRSLDHYPVSENPWHQASLDPGGGEI